MGTTSIAPDALRTAALRLDAAADILSVALRVHLGGVQSADAAISRLVADIGQWTRSARDLADVMRNGAERYADGEVAAAMALR